MQLSGHDIRMKDFRRAILRGYAEADVDDFLMALAVEIDRRDRERHARQNGSAGAATVAPRAMHVRDETATADSGHAPTRASGLDPEVARRVAADVIEQARQAALEIQAEAIAGRDAIQADARLAAQAIIDDAKASAERGLIKARQRAEEMLQHARDQQEQASRADAEAQLRLAHVDQELARRAAALSNEARRLDELAGWIAERELAPESVLDHLDEAADDGAHVPAHAAPEVIERSS